MLLLSAAEADDDVDDRLVLEDVPVLAVLADVLAIASCAGSIDQVDAVGLADDREA